MFPADWQSAPDLSRKSPDLRIARRMQNSERDFVADDELGDRREAKEEPKFADPVGEAALGGIIAFIDLPNTGLRSCYWDSANLTLCILRAGTHNIEPVPPPNRPSATNGSPAPPTIWRNWPPRSRA